MGVADDQLSRADRAQAPAVGEAGGDAVDQFLELAPVGREGLGGVAQSEGEAADLVVPHGCSLEGAIGGQTAARQGGEGRIGQAGSAEVSIPVRARQQQRAQPVGLCGSGGSQFLAGTQQDAQRFAGAVGAWGG
jgi:hypothetical protein